MDSPFGSIFLSEPRCNLIEGISRLSHDRALYEDDLPYPCFKQQQDNTTVNTGTKNICHSINLIDTTLRLHEEEGSMQCNMSIMEDTKSQSESNEIIRCGKKVFNKPSKNGKLNILNSLYYALADTFNGNTNVIDAYSLKPYELGLIKWVVKNKLKNQVHKVSVQRLNLQEEGNFKQLQKYIEQDSVRGRKKGEMIRFIFKLTMKGLKKIYKSTSMENKEFNERDFLNYHFKRHSQETGTNIMEYADPLDKTALKNPRFTCLNKEYLSLIFKNEQFKDTFLTYVNNYLENDYKYSVYGKFYHFFKLLRKQLWGTDEDKRISIINEFISKDSKKIMNLPWTCHEVRLAIDKFTKHITRLSENKLNTA